tara:strand:- start:1090 stop:1539 length:450 start_codon:yes stop_codon:yes gene_type:complete
MEIHEEILAVQKITFMIFEQARLADQNLPDEQAACFSEDAVVNYYGEEIHGRDHIYALLLPALNKWIASCHSISNVQVTVHNTMSASSVSYVYAWHRVNADGVGDYEVRGQYHDEWICTEDDWKISKRTFLTMAATPPRPNAPGIGRLP